MENYPSSSTNYAQYPLGYIPLQYYAPQVYTPYTYTHQLNGDPQQYNGNVGYPQSMMTPAGPSAYGQTPMLASPQLPVMQPPRLGRPQYILEQAKPALKPALKKTKIASAPAIPLTRKRTGSMSARNNSLSRQRSVSNAAQYVPDHIFVSLHSSNKLKVENVIRHDMFDRLDDTFIPSFPGTLSDRGRTSYELEFPGKLWDARGREARNVYKVICRLFMILADEGFHYVTSIDAGHPIKPPRLVFANMHNPSPLDFFCAALGNNGYEMVIYHAPPQLAVRLGLEMQARFPQKVHAETDEDNVCSIRLTNISEPTEKNFLISYLFKYLCDEGYYIDASVPLARKGLFGLGGRREVWMFKSTPPPPTTI